MEENVRISINLNFNPNTLGCYGFSQDETQEVENKTLGTKSYTVSRLSCYICVSLLGVHASL